MVPLVAPVAKPAIAMPSMSTKGSPSMIMRSAKVPESPSSALQTTYLRSATAPATDALVPLVRLAVARSGDKGDHANIGVMARDPAYLPYIEAALTPNAVAAWFAHVLRDGAQAAVQRWALPGSDSFNFLLPHALGSGGAASLRTDPQGKAFAQMLLEFPVPVPASMVK